MFFKKLAMKRLYKILLVFTFVIVFIKKILVLGMIFVGLFFFPEASQILRHYCFGDGSQLNINSEYIKNSPVVKKNLSRMKIGERRKISIQQREDWRLSYALNPFIMEKKKDKVVITQWIQFSKSDKVKTWFGPISLPDNIVHTFECTPYMARCEWKI